MNVAQASSIINTIAAEHGSGLLETLEYMHGVYNESREEWSAQFDIEERQAYWIVMEGMRELFYGKGE